MHKEYLIDKDLYEVHDGEKIWSKYWKKYLSGNISRKGYVVVRLKCIDEKPRLFFFHRVVWYFLKGEILEGMQINHLDENKQNNHISNLSLCTPKENSNWASRNERSSAKRINHPLRSKLVVAVKNDIVVMEFASTMEAERHGFKHSAVSQCCRKCFNKEGNNYYKGYQWFFKEDWLKIQQATHDRVACGKLNILI